MRKTIFVLFTLFVTQLSFSQLRLPNLFSSHMVLQQNSKVTLWGWGSPLEKIAITTSWDNKTDTAVVLFDATWKHEIQTPKAGGPYTISLQGYTKVELQDVMIGEVWVASGQSNMEWSYYAGVNDIDEELQLGKQNNIRLLQVPKETSDSEKKDVPLPWQVCDTELLKSFSAAAYFFAKKLQGELNIPIGIINASWGATAAEVWTPQEVFAKDEVLRKAAATHEQRLWCPTAPAVAYNAMIAPLTQLPIAGAIWYQGESNIGIPKTYRQLMMSMIDAWRSKWKKEFPFYFVQIAPYTYGDGYGAALLREQQQFTTQHPKTGMVVVSDLVHDVKDIHPRDKKNVGFRLADFALNEVYQTKQTVYKSPEVESFKIEKNKIIIDFKNAPNGLEMRGKEAFALFITDDSKNFLPATATIKGNQLIVSHLKIKNPVAVRYMFTSDGIGNLFSKEGLPVAPFRTDNWELD